MAPFMRAQSHSQTASASPQTGQAQPLASMRYRPSEPARQPRAARPRLRHLMADEAQLVAAASVIDFANQHKNIDPSTLGPDEAYKLRKAAREKIRH